MNAKFLIVLLVVLTTACNAPRTLYLKNNTDQTVTLQIDQEASFSPASIENTFIDSLNGRQLQSGYLIINFGPGKWNKTDQQSLKTILGKISVTPNGTSNSFRLPEDIHVTHYGSFVNELVVKINQPK